MMEAFCPAWWSPRGRDVPVPACLSSRAIECVIVDHPDCLHHRITSQAHAGMRESIGRCGVPQVWLAGLGGAHKRLGEQGISDGGGHQPLAEMFDLACRGCDQNCLYEISGAFDRGSHGLRV